ncbi:hypothetical protein DMW20_11755 [Vibrio parahaemolyticus]|nr:hypothetical protein [Vibrio parahaemolyticus]
MAYGILSAGQRDLDIATGLMRQNVSREYQRNQLEEQLEAKEKAERTQMGSMGAGLGLKYGMSDAGRAAIDEALGYGGSAMPAEAGTAADVGTLSAPTSGGLGTAAEVGSIAQPVAGEGAMGLSSSVAPELAADVGTSAATDAVTGAATDAALSSAATDAAIAAGTDAAVTAGTTAATTAGTTAATTAAAGAGGAAAGAEAGSMAGPIGMVAGAVIGLALNEIF